MVMTLIMIIIITNRRNTYRRFMVATKEEKAVRFDQFITECRKGYFH